MRTVSDAFLKNLALAACCTLPLALAAKGYAQAEAEAAASEESPATAPSAASEEPSASAPSAALQDSAEADPPAIDPAVGNPDVAESVVAAKPDAVPAKGGVAADGSIYDFLGDGARHEISGRGFSIKTPRGWEVYAQHPTLSLLMQVPWAKGQKYQRTIQVASFSGPRYMDEMTAREYEALIVKKFSETTAVIENYRVRNHMTIELADGREAILFYTEFSIQGVELMQAHVLASAADRHFLTTYTDLAAHFEGDLSERYLSEAWESMISLELQSATPFRYQTFMRIGYVVGGIFLLGLLVLIARWVRARRAFRSYAQGRMPGGEDGVTEATAVELTEADEEDDMSYSQLMTGTDGTQYSLADEPLTSDAPRSLVSGVSKVRHGKSGKQTSLHESKALKDQPSKAAAPGTIFPSAFALSRIQDEDDGDKPT